MASYATLDDLSVYGMREAGVDNIEFAELALDAASREADGYIASRHSVPLSTWPPSLTSHVCAIAAWTILRARGVSGTGADEVIREAYLDAIRFLKDVGAGRASLIGATVAESPSPAATSGAYADSDEIRGW